MQIITREIVKIRKGDEMQSEKQRIIAIVNELVTFLLHNKATSIQINLKESDEDSRIYVCSNIADSKVLSDLKNKIMANRSEEVESLYWKLLGDENTKDELYLIGKMVNDSNIDYSNSKLVMITLVRKKN
ncbi:hypothetical protein [Sporosalibacterium faouarense]|uniref:hypothetical protein n=1 Tax=Sporosalibacterium faouarense TaxID=516123 RepID=UPI00141C5E43|nr:hypothetical protein [Sporosalibacterium faouarense]MTI48476.1 hypothetical protein [Bacillota bacterium]